MAESHRQPTGQCCFAIAAAFGTCPSLRFGHVNIGRPVMRAANQHWVYNKFVAWLVPFIQESGYNSSDSLKNTHQLDGIDDILKSIWGGNKRTIAEAVELLSTKQLPSNQNEFARYDHFTFNVLNHPFLIPGWEDCLVGTKYPDLDQLPRCSILRENLKSYIYDGR